ncbi:MAG: bifunctional methylenetetrahydrofolate dehydrogenase/methenyltetrahydrofolate cyclohydrolase FolD [Anaerolineae bacterium]|nr:MAG: bifunctional methylenetetrahydrofolate dehydrogenase/methenyltetrahydrofolate cyclohydrolase FolD [Anaerolineae bacterium]
MYIDGKALATQVRDEIKQTIDKRIAEGKARPGLATVLIGENPASQTYVSAKRKACAEVGIESFAHELPASTSQAEVEALVRQLNENPTVHGILVQLPLPDHLNEKAILDLISIEKDVDGFHPLNMGLLAMKGRKPHFVACTPQGVMEMLKSTNTPLEGARAVVLGRSNIVGIPMALLLINANATVTVAHSRTKNLPEVCREADVLIAAVGRAQMVKGDWVKPGAVVIDVGTNRVDDASKKSGFRLVGDVDTEAAAQVASAISPVPGGVGPMTIAMLLKNTLKAAEASE